MVSHVPLLPTFQSPYTHSPKQLYLNPHQLGFATQLQMTSLSFPELRDFAKGLVIQPGSSPCALFRSTEAPSLRPLQPPQQHLLQTLQRQCLGHSQPQHRGNSSVAEGQKTLTRTGRRLVEGWGAGNTGKNSRRIKGR